MPDKPADPLSGAKPDTLPARDGAANPRPAAKPGFDPASLKDAKLPSGGKHRHQVTHRTIQSTKSRGR